MFYKINFNFMLIKLDLLGNIKIIFKMKSDY